MRPPYCLNEDASAIQEDQMRKEGRKANAKFYIKNIRLLFYDLTFCETKQEKTGQDTTQHDTTRQTQNKARQNTTGNRHCLTNLFSPPRPTTGQGQGQGQARKGKLDFAHSSLCFLKQQDLTRQYKTPPPPDPPRTRIYTRFNTIDILDKGHDTRKTRKDTRERQMKRREKGRERQDNQDQTRQSTDEKTQERLPRAEKRKTITDTNNDNTTNHQHQTSTPTPAHHTPPANKLNKLNPFS